MAWILVGWLCLPIGIGMLKEAAEDLQPELLPWGWTWMESSDVGRL